MNRHHFLYFITPCIALFSSMNCSYAEVDQISQACVKIHTVQRRPDLFQPWRRKSSDQITGSGVIVDIPREGKLLADVEGPLILTNAHVVRYANQLFVQFNQSSDQVSASVLAVAPDIDLALLKIDKPESIEEHESLQLAETPPNVRDEVRAYGFPMGGDQLSVTKGIVSRIEIAQFYFNSSGLRIQVDAALNPGNSGGPAVSNGKIVGLVFSGIRQADNIGYLISTDEIRLFLDDIKDGTYEGKYYLFDSFQSAENSAVREMLHLTKEMTGLIVSEPYKDDEDYPLERWDVVTHIGDYPLDNLGMVKVREGLRLYFSYFVPELTAQEKVPLTILRAGEKLQVEVPLAREKDDLIQPLKYATPSYAILGPLVFTEPGKEMLTSQSSAAARWHSWFIHTRSPLISRINDTRAFPEERLVMVPTDMFSHIITKGYDTPRMRVLTEFNNQKVNNLAHLVDMYRNTQEEYLEFRFAGLSENLVFRRSEFAQATEEILENEGIRYQFSSDLR